MNLSAPKQITWLVSIVLVVLAVLGQYGVIAALAPHAFLLLLLAAVLLALGCMVAGL